MEMCGFQSLGQFVMWLNNSICPTPLDEVFYVFDEKPCFKSSKTDMPLNHKKHCLSEKAILSVHKSNNSKHIISQRTHHFLQRGDRHSPLIINTLPSFDSKQNVTER